MSGRDSGKVEEKGLEGQDSVPSLTAGKRHACTLTKRAHSLLFNLHQNTHEKKSKSISLRPKQCHMALRGSNRP